MKSNQEEKVEIDQEFMREAEERASDHEDDLAGFQPTPATTMNRKERSERKKFYTKELKKHMKRKPSVNTEEEDEKRQGDSMIRIQKWLMRLHILQRKLYELEEVKRNNKGSNKPGEVRD